MLSIWVLVSSPICSDFHHSDCVPSVLVLAEYLTFSLLVKTLIVAPSPTVVPLLNRITKSRFTFGLIDFVETLGLALRRGDGASQVINESRYAGPGDPRLQARVSTGRTEKYEGEKPEYKFAPLR